MAPDAGLDAEAAATHGQFVSVTGSHSAKRDDCANNPDTRHVFRFRIDPTTGKVLREPSNDPNGALMGYSHTQRLWPLMASFPAFRR
ncbi:hypothetical protein GCM10007874_08580 [Labrys miyagiensis]|uniref:Uncharacterized protein n=1 Tax=Labrys miyagiensis TaxID=346912 RepID=A0ABQ6CDV6_9HYPH|nr:hypothetical protein GCM10007874_08580 [Labrys miyagiensis]